MEALSKQDLRRAFAARQSKEDTIAFYGAAGNHAEALSKHTAVRLFDAVYHNIPHFQHTL